MKCHEVTEQPPEPVIDTGSLNTTTDDSLVASGDGAAPSPDRETAIVSPTSPRRRAFRLMPPRGDRSSEDEEDGGGREIQVLRQVREESTICH